MNYQQNHKKETLSLEQQGKLETLKIHLTSLHAMLLQRGSFLVLIASLNIALLVVFSLDRTIINLSNPELKILVTVLLISVPIFLLAYIIEIQIAINKTHKSIEEIYGEEVLKKSTFKKILDSVVANLSLFACVLVLLVIGYILYSIWFYS